MKDSLLMLINFFKNPKETGAVAVSSSYVTNEIMKHIDFKNSKNIIELGPGLGTFTKAILEKANRDANVICFEVNEEFCKYINKNCADKRLIVINKGAENIRKKLNEMGIGKADCIVSGLPFKNFSVGKKKKILTEVKEALNGRFILFQYTNNLSAMLSLHFKKVEKSFVPLNIPPCFIFKCED